MGCFWRVEGLPNWKILLRQAFGGQVGDGKKLKRVLAQGQSRCERRSGYGVTRLLCLPRNWPRSIIVKIYLL
jgi:hypothetical protein